MPPTPLSLGIRDRPPVQGQAAHPCSGLWALPVLSSIPTSPFLLAVFLHPISSPHCHISQNKFSLHVSFRCFLTFHLTLSPFLACLCPNIPNLSAPPSFSIFSSPLASLRPCLLILLYLRVTPLPFCVPPRPPMLCSSLTYWCSLRCCLGSFFTAPWVSSLALGIELPCM